MCESRDVSGHYSTPPPVNLWEFYYFIFTKGRCDQLAELIQRSSLVTKSLGPVNMTSGTGDCRKTEQLLKNFVKKNWSAEYQELNKVSHTLLAYLVKPVLDTCPAMKPNHSATWNLLNCFSCISGGWVCQQWAEYSAVFQLPQLAGNQAVLDNLHRHGNRLQVQCLDKQFIKFVNQFLILQDWHENWWSLPDMQEIGEGVTFI